MKTRFIVDLNRCTGCQACTVACMVENRLAPGLGLRKVHTFNEPHLPGAARYSLSLSCLHCEAPACVAHCPSKACFRDEATGRVVIDPDRCMGCRYCEWACAYGAPVFDEAAGVMTKCTLCAHLQEEGSDPACAAQCPTNALQVDDGSRAVPGTDQVEGFPETANKPSIVFIPVRRDRPDCTAMADGNAIKKRFRASDFASLPRISLSTEWPLALFTLAAAILCAWIVAAQLAPVRVHAGLFLFSGIGCLALSALHLGRKQKAIHSGANLKSSWLSREIVLFSAFLGFSFLWLIAFRESVILGWIASISGLACLFSMDRIYDITVKKSPFPLHSAGVFLTSLFLTAVFTAGPVAVLAFGSVKLVLYMGRKGYFWRTGQNARLLPSALRLGFAFAAVALSGRPDLALALFIASEAIDRCEFYMEQDMQSSFIGGWEEPRCPGS
ncbi:MAG: DmsC/YnfH family molybdoenzyme membrane anchor subunit [Planctomycetota bacterium]